MMAHSLAHNSTTPRSALVSTSSGAMRTISRQRSFSSGRKSEGGGPRGPVVRGSTRLRDLFFLNAPFSSSEAVGLRGLGIVEIHKTDIFENFHFVDVKI